MFHYIFILYNKRLIFNKNMRSAQSDPKARPRFPLVYPDRQETLGFVTNT